MEVVIVCSSDLACLVAFESIKKRETTRKTVKMRTLVLFLCTIQSLYSSIDFFMQKETFHKRVFLIFFSGPRATHTSFYLPFFEENCIIFSNSSSWCHIILFHSSSSILFWNNTQSISTRTAAKKGITHKMLGKIPFLHSMEKPLKMVLHNTHGSLETVNKGHLRRHRPDLLMPNPPNRLLYQSSLAYRQ